MSQHKEPSKKPTDFPSFPKLPLEMQDEIWKFALDNDVPAAHIVNIVHERIAGQQTAAPIMQRLIVTGYSSRMKPVSPAREALVQTCQRSRLIVEKIIKQRKQHYHPAVQSFSHPPPHNRYVNWRVIYHGGYHDFHTKTVMIPATPPLQKVYTSRDLIIISNPWLGGNILSIANRPDIGTSVKYAAIPYLSSDGSWERVMARGRRYFMDQIFHVLDHLQILYILLHPDEIRKGERFEVLHLLPAMKQHLDRYKRSREETSPTRFQYRDRVYHEISDVLLLKLSKLGGLPLAVTHLEQIAKEQRAKNGGDKPPLIIRFMTW
ncbi:hypothetical protein FPOA_03362 [Fusarium poae]|uniref:2EXR domain-containing protein n=1 Tax=Fusarium poae TaxID=36050 RepID=A0A1B8B9M4_FUSPO|nr:hypothetical protein FPOA_03362 [Fusarium poae]